VLFLTYAAKIIIEEDIVEKLAAQQLREELWGIVTKALNDNKQLQIFQMRDNSGRIIRVPVDM
jgi:hypothetical protein